MIGQNPGHALGHISLRRKAPEPPTQAVSLACISGLTSRQGCRLSGQTSQALAIPASTPPRKLCKLKQGGSQVLAISLSLLSTLASRGRSSAGKAEG